MERKYLQAIKAGAIAAVVLIFLSLALLVVVNIVAGPKFIEESNTWQERYNSQRNSGEVPELPPMSFFAIGFGMLAIIGLMFLMFVVAGILAGRMTEFTTKKDAAILGAVAGAVAEIIHRPFALVLTLIFDIVAPSADTSLIGAFVGNLICLLPLFLVAGIVLGAVGALIYSLFKKKPVETAGTA